MDSWILQRGPVRKPFSDSFEKRACLCEAEITFQHVATLASLAFNRCAFAEPS